MNEDEPKVSVIVPRIRSRQTLEQCRVEAMAVAAERGFHGEPEVQTYDGWPRSHGGPMSNPQGYFFLWPADAGDAST